MREPRSEENTDQETAILRELQALQQALTHLTTVEQRLRSQQAALDQQINEASRQAYQAQQANQTDLYSRAMDQRSTTLAAAANLQEQFGRLTARKQEIAGQQQHLQAQLSTLLATQRQADLSLRDSLSQSSALDVPSAIVAPPQRTAHRRLLWFSTLTVLVLVAASLGLIWYFHPSSTAQTPHPITLSKNNQPFYHPAGDLPSNQDCVSHLNTLCLSPEVIQQAFRLNPLYRSGYDGKGQTIVLLGAGNTTTLQADVHQFDQTWGLPDPALTIVEPHGPPAPYTCPGGIDYPEGESTLDVEWAHAIAPGAKIVLLIGSNHAGENPQENCVGDLSLLEDVDYATRHHLGQVLSMSLGGSELGLDTYTASEKADEQQYFQQGDAIFQQAVTQHITVLAAAGDDGATNPNDASNPHSYWNQPNVSWPASDPNILAVGGTTLSLDAANDYHSEVVWNDSKTGATGGGLSAIFAEPNYQKQVAGQALFRGQRGLPDVAFPAAGFLVYNSSPLPGLDRINPQWAHWDIVGGTSASAPCWAGLIAIANQIRGRPIGLVQPALYALQGKGMHDLTSGTNSFHGVSGYQAQKGFDLVSGWGTPIADQFIPDLVQAVEQS